MSKIDHSLFKAAEHALEHIDEPCPLCQAELKIKHGKSGPFIGCSQYPVCHFTKPLHEHESADIKLIDGSACPLCSEQLAIKKGRYGLFIGCSNFPACTYIESSKATEEQSIKCPSCVDGQLSKRANKFGKQFYPCNNYPQCKYVVNFPPVASPCPVCHWPIMLEKKSAHGLILQCPQRSCGHKVDKQIQAE